MKPSKLPTPMSHNYADEMLGRCAHKPRDARTIYTFIRLGCCTGWERQCSHCGRRVEVHEEKCSQHPMGIVTHSQSSQEAC